MDKYNRVKTYDDFMATHAKIHVSILSNMGFFTAPASTKYHGAYEGGLFDHSLEVTKTLVELTEKLGLKWGRSYSPYIVGMYHDLCKCDNYVEINSFEEVVPIGIRYKHNSDIIIPGHGDKSLIMIQKHLRLTDEEIACIRWHMGAYEKDPKMWDYYNRAVEKYPNVLWTHTADMLASHVKNI